ncbi:MAG: hypothetical protein M5U08_15375 [Burkholderiales bacterium]|nr:hypothetical protein [Burkholderiales bacterium]
MEAGSVPPQCTAHARTRIRPRGIDDAGRATRLAFRRAEHQPRGPSVFYLDERGRRRIERALGEASLNALGKGPSTCAVMARDAALTTVGHRHRRIRRYA